MGIRGSNAFDVGLRCCPSIPLISSFLSGMLAFLTAKSLPLGAERDPGAAASKHLFHEDGLQIPFEKIFYRQDSSARGGQWASEPRSVQPYCVWQLTKSAAAMGRVCSAIGFTPDCYLLTVVYADALQGKSLYRFNPSEPNKQYKVLYNPAFCVSKFFALLKGAKLEVLRDSAPELEVGSEGGAQLDVLRDGGAKLDRARLGRVLPLFLMSIALAFAVVDVAVGAVMRVLQAPYYLLMFLWHLRERDFETAIIHGHDKEDKAAEFQGSVFGAMDKAFTCFAVVVNSAVWGLVLHIHSGVLGFSAVAGMCGVLAVLTVVAVSFTVFNMNAADKKLRVEAETLSHKLLRYGQPSVAPPLYDIVDGVSVINESVKGRRGMVKTNTRVTAHLLYLSEIGRGAYLPSHFRAGFGGTTAFSFIEEVLHAPSHLLASAAINMVERCFGDQSSPQAQPSSQQAQLS